MSRPTPEPLQVWRSKNFTTNKTCLHIQDTDTAGRITCDRYVDGVKQTDPYYIQKRSLLADYWLVTYHWSGDNANFIQSGNIETLSVR
jgi:hypothetical protein